MGAREKNIATMEAGLKKLETQEQKYSAELDKALSEYAELKAQAAELDPVELHEARNAIRPVQEKEVEQQLEGTMHEKPSLIMLLSAKQEASRLLGEDAEEEVRVLRQPGEGGRERGGVHSRLQEPLGNGVTSVGYQLRHALGVSVQRDASAAAGRSKE